MWLSIGPQIFWGIQVLSFMFEIHFVQVTTIELILYLSCSPSCKIPFWTLNLILQRTYPKRRKPRQHDKILVKISQNFLTVWTSTPFVDKYAYLTVAVICRLDWWRPSGSYPIRFSFNRSPSNSLLRFQNARLQTFSITWGRGKSPHYYEGINCA